MDATLRRSGRLSWAGALVLLAVAAVALPGVARPAIEASGQPAGQTTPTAAEPPQPETSGPEREGQDLYGDPLPRGAIARLGTLRFRRGWLASDIRFLPDSRSLVSSTLGSLGIWDAESGKLKRRLDLGGKGLGAFDVRPDGKFLVAAIAKGDYQQETNDYELRAWDLSTWQARTLAAWTDDIGTSQVECVAIAPDGATIATGGGGGMILLWDASGRNLAEVKIAKGAQGFQDVQPLEFLADGRLRASVYRDGTYLWDPRAGSQPERPEPPFDGMFALSANGQRVARGDEATSAVEIWDAATRRLLSRFKLHRPSRALWANREFSPDGTLLAVPVATGEIDLYESQTGRLVRSLAAHGRRRTRITISPDNQLLAAAWGSAVKVWRIPTGERLDERFVGHEDGVFQIHFTPDGKTVVTGSRDGSIRVWDAGTGRQIRVLGQEQRLLTRLTLSPDGRQVLSCGFDDTVRLWDLASGRLIYRLAGHGSEGGNSQCALGFSPDGKRFLSFGPNLFLRTWSTANGKVLAEHAIRPSGLTIGWAEDGTLWVADPLQPGSAVNVYHVLMEAQITADATRLLLSDFSRTIYLFDTRSGREVDKLQTEDGLANFVLSPDGKWLITVETRRNDEEDDREGEPALTWNRTVLRVREISSMKMIREIKPVGDYGHRLAISPDGTLLAANMSLRGLSNGRGRVLKRWISVWDLRTGRLHARIDEGLSGSRWHLAFSPDDRRLASGHDDTVLIWDLEQFRVTPGGRGGPQP